MQAFGGAISHLSELPPNFVEKYGYDPRERDDLLYQPTKMQAPRIPIGQLAAGLGGEVQMPVTQPVGTPEQVQSPLDRGVAGGTSVAGGTNIGTLDYSSTNTGYSAGQLSPVTDPDKTMANVAQSQHESYIRNFRDFENALIAARDDTSLIDAAREDAPEQARIAREVAERQRSRFGLNQTAVEARETQRASQRGEAINLAGGLNEARLAQRDANRRLLGDLINIGQGVNRSSLSQLGTAAENATARKNAYQNAKAQHKAQTWGMIGSLGSTALMAAFLL